MHFLSLGPPVRPTTKATSDDVITLDDDDDENEVRFSRLIGRNVWLEVERFCFYLFHQMLSYVVQVVDTADECTNIN